MTSTQTDLEWLDDQIKDAECLARLSPPRSDPSYEATIKDSERRTEALERARRLRSIRERLVNA